MCAIYSISACCTLEVAPRIYIFFSSTAAGEWLFLHLWAHLPPHLLQLGAAKWEGYPQTICSCIPTGWFGSTSWSDGKIIHKSKTPISIKSAGKLQRCEGTAGQWLAALLLAAPCICCTLGVIQSQTCWENRPSLCCHLRRHHHSKVLTLQKIFCTREHILGLSPCFFFDAVFVCEKVLCRRSFLMLHNSNNNNNNRITSRTTVLCIGGEVRNLVLWEVLKSSMVLLVCLSNIPTTSCNRKN